ncbi:ABC transporter substrate-binding protein [Streptomyces sp. bgisy100]|uniref:ABC transporter substrate-binding protein n=1 Tax=Streptomyces sp. bgisy100 TaxID=3413783 RepID=UPI003D7540E8
MAHSTEWTFTDDRGRVATARRTPATVVAYIQAGATLSDHGIQPAGIFGSNHDGDSPDPAKAGALPLEEIDYLGSGDRLGVDSLLRAAPDLVVAVAYGGDQVYGLAPEVAKGLEERVPVVVLDVGQGRSLADVRDRFTALARSLGAPGSPAGAGELDRAHLRLRAAAGDAGSARVVALSPAGPDSVHLARPSAWRDLRALADHGVGMVEPEAGPGANWSTVDWATAASLRPDIVLTDSRANALPVDQLRRIDGWQETAARAQHVPWNPEIPCSHIAHALFFETVADALQAWASA